MALHQACHSRGPHDRVGEWWSYEIGGFVLGTVSKTEQAIHLNILNINAILFMVSLFFCVHVIISNTARFICLYLPYLQGVATSWC